MTKMLLVHRLFVYAVACALLSSCASVPTYLDSTAPAAATIRGKAANYFKFYVGEAHVFVAEIDGRPAAGGSHKVTPGKHQIGLTMTTIGYQQANGYVDIELLPNREYYFRATLVGISFRIDLVDETDGGDRVVKSFKFLKGSSAQPSSVPIIVPVNS